MTDPVPTLTNVLALPEGLRPDIEEWARGHLVFQDNEGNEHQCFSVADGCVYLPRGAVQSCPLPVEYEDRRTSVPVQMPEPLITMRDYQSVPVSKMMKKGQGILRAPTGSGKTACLLWLAAKLGQRTLILVHTKDLLSQWQQRCEQALGFKPGVIGAGQWEEHELITIAMVQTLMRYERLPADWVASWGTVMLDEAHRAPASSFLHVLSQMTSKHIYGATATPTRRDGNHPMMHAIIGPVVASIPEDALVTSGQLIRPVVHMMPTGFRSKIAYRMATAHNAFQRNRIYQQVASELAEDHERARVIARQVVKVRHRNQLVLSKRIKHLELINQMIYEIDPELSTFVLTGSHNGEDRANILQMVADGEISVLLSTQLADEGLDLPILDVLHLTFPGRGLEKLQQQVGRIMRTYKGKSDAHVYDYVDSDISIFTKQAIERWFWYDHRGSDMRGWEPAAVTLKKARGKGK